MALSVIGAGLGRTGTLSLKIALEQLGFGRCHHMLEVIANLDSARDWIRASDGGDVDWDRVFEGYGASVDWPSCSFYRALAGHFPNAKVILTVRDPVKWVESMENTIFLALRRMKDDVGNPMAAMVRKIVLEGMFGGNIDDRAHCIAVYERHNAAVKRDIAASRLLVFDVAEGWKPLCDFLGVSVPDAPFPRVNSTEEFRQRALAMARPPS